jgi:hypothetical protein
LPAFTPPFIYTDDDGIAYTYDSLEYLAQDVEFANDFENDYQCRDAQGARIRIVVSRMSALLAQVVPDEFTIDDLRIHQGEVGGSPAMIEVFNEIALRGLTRKGDGSWRTTPLEGEEVTVGPLDGSLKADEFNKIWTNTAWDEDGAK